MPALNESLRFDVSNIKVVSNTIVFSFLFFFVAIVRIELEIETVFDIPSTSFCMFSSPGSPLLFIVANYRETRSHNLVTIPPAGWTDVAHRHGTRVLGTFITEWEAGHGVCAELLRSEETAERAAAQLTRIAVDHGFDGWLVNIENKVDPGASVDHLVHFVSSLTLQMRAAKAPAAREVVGTGGGREAPVLLLLTLFLLIFLLLLRATAAATPPPCCGTTASLTRGSWRGRTA